MNSESNNSTDYAVGELVRVIDGGFKDSSGTITALDAKEATATVLLTIFGREVPVPLSVKHLERVNFYDAEDFELE